MPLYEGQESEVSALKKEEKKSCIKKSLTMISIGKYRTPLYFRGSDSYTTIGGGLITILCVIIIVSIGLYTLVPIMKNDSWE